MAFRKKKARRTSMEVHELIAYQEGRPIPAYTNMDTERTERLAHTTLIDAIQVGTHKWVHLRYDTRDNTTWVFIPEKG